MNEQHCAAQSILANGISPAAFLQPADLGNDLCQYVTSVRNPAPSFKLYPDDSDDCFPAPGIHNTPDFSCRALPAFNCADGESTTQYGSSDDNFSNASKHSYSEVSSGSTTTSNNSIGGPCSDVSTIPKTSGRKKRKRGTRGADPDKRQKLERKAELARAARQRQKEYIAKLEGDVKALQNHLAEQQKLLEAQKIENLQELGQMASFGRTILGAMQGFFTPNGCSGATNHSGSPEGPAKAEQNGQFQASSVRDDASFFHVEWGQATQALAA